MSKRGGHIPAACHLEWSDLVDKDGRFLDAAALRARLEKLGIKPGEPVITHCQGGGRASVDAFALERLGLPTRNYYLGWSDWGNAEQTPVATGAPARSPERGFDISCRHVDQGSIGGPADPDADGLRQDSSKARHPCVQAWCPVTVSYLPGGRPDADRAWSMSRSGSDGILPSGRYPGSVYRTPISSSSACQAPGDPALSPSRPSSKITGWPPASFEQTAGAWQGAVTSAVRRGNYKERAGALTCLSSWTSSTWLTSIT